MKKTLGLSLSIVLFALFTGCLDESTTISSPHFTEDFSKVESELSQTANCEFVDFVDEVTLRGKDTVKREIRIDLFKPAPFPNEQKIRQLIQLVNARLTNKNGIVTYKINEVGSQRGDTNSFPNPHILRTVTLNAKDL